MRTVLSNKYINDNKILKINGKKKPKAKPPKTYNIKDEY